MASLLWLGGAEQELLARQTLTELAGQWRGEDGSQYHLFCAEGKIDVLTVRPSGRRLFTKGLIRSSPRERSVVWGKDPRKLFTLTLDEGVAMWFRDRQRFVWCKLQ